MSLIPATILTGFLGSGKTTLLKRVLSEAHGQKIAVIENEFGEENIDNDILVTDVKEQIIQMSNGCICCTIREDLRSTLQDLAARKRRGATDGAHVAASSVAAWAGSWLAAQNSSASHGPARSGSSSRPA